MRRMMSKFLAAYCPTILTTRIPGLAKQEMSAPDGLLLTIPARMFRSIQPQQFLLTVLAGWINRRQLEAIEYLKEEHRLPKERLGGRCLCFTDAERRRLARRAYALGRKTLSELHTLVDTMGLATASTARSGWHISASVRTSLSETVVVHHQAPVA